ncbi:Gfo/Idh/MocA family protein [Nocardiopsis salina]|uniref:Gfo/Idh/MocA family protein n=1 Tax=Nocardiopsis salina TaxID=245836 RepID=UPI000348182D|nr:Gfo/Idh/MocA family oxidoreductase [Nocardiopsis salina]
MTVRIGVVGTGWIGAEHIRRITTSICGAEVVAVTDIDADRAAGAVEGTGARVLSSEEEVIAAQDVDAVVVASWGPAHAESVLAAIKAGKPVLCEKPLATSVEDCHRIMEAEAAHGSRLVQVGFMRRYDAGYLQMKRVLDSGDLGTPLMAHCVHRNQSVPEAYHSEMEARDTAVHEIDTLRWLTGQEVATAQVLTPRRTALRHEHLVDPQIILLEMADGSRVDIEVFVNCQYGYEIGCEIVGEKGTVRLPEVPAPVVRSSGSAGTEVPQDWVDRFDPAFDAEFTEWVDTVRRGAEPAGAGAWDGYAAAAVCDAAVQALHSGEVVPVGMAPRPALYGDAQ